MNKRLSVVNFTLVVASALIVASCAMTARKRPPSTATPGAKEALNQAQVQLAAGGTRSAIKTLKAIVSQHPGTDVEDDALIMLGDIYYSKDKFDLAYNQYQKVFGGEVYSPREVDAMFKASKAMRRLGQSDEALSLTRKALEVDSVSVHMKTDIYHLRYELLNQMGDHLEALEALIYLSKNAENEKDRKGFNAKALDYVESRLGEKELLKVANNRSFGSVRGYAKFRVGTLLFENREFGAAKGYLNDVRDLLPDSELAEKSEHLINQINARRRVEPRTIGAILPLSGRHAHVAKKTLRGLQLGLGIYGKETSSLRLAVIDSGGNPDHARRAVERLVTENHVIAIVGSLLSRTSVAVASKANELGVPTIGLSQKSGLTDVGDHVFRNALTSEMQVRHLVNVAMTDQGLKNFAILYPNDRYGVEYANLFWDEVLARGGQIRAIQPYNPKETDFNGVIQRLVGTYYLEDRRAEYELRINKWLEGQTRINSRVSPPDDLLPAVIDFDAVFIPDSTKALGQIAPMLAYHNVKNVRLLGTNLWNSRSLVKRGQHYVEGSLFVDSFLTSSKSFKESSFYRQYKQTFGEAPGLFATQAYDAGLVLRQVLAAGERTRMGIKEKLAMLSAFPGSLGPLNMSENRELSRPMVSLTVEKGRINRVPSKN